MHVSFKPLPVEADEPEFTAIYELWRAKVRSGRLPSRADFDPADLPHAILRHMLLFDVERHPDRLRFRFRLASTGFVDLVGREVTGTYIDELAPPDRTDPVREALEEISNTGRPIFLASRLTLVSKDYYYVKRLGLPLAQDGVRVDMIMASFLPKERSAAQQLPESLHGNWSEPRENFRCVL
nr:PAS domain-containing protein [uncultured Dongia sp.]